MNEIKLSDINIYDIGNSIQISGLVWSGKGRNFITILPDKDKEFTGLEVMPLTLDEWVKLMRQTDIVEVEIFSKDPTGLVKKILRKSQRQIDNRLQWECFQRDGYQCRYCGRRGIPLTVDHIIIWEEGGPTIKENLLSSCKNDNKDRGSMSYEQWLLSPEYAKASQGLDELQKQKNLDVLKTLPALRAMKVAHIHTR